MNIGNCISKNISGINRVCLKLLQLLSTENTTELSILGNYQQRAETHRNLFVIDTCI